MYWGSFSGDFLEKAMSVLVAQDEPNTIRRTPASGDGGIDLMVPGAEGFVVEQVKGFTGRVDASRKRQIEGSWAELRRDARLPAGKRRILEYRLVVPIDPTPDEQEWFEDLVADAEFPCYWRGEPHWHSLAARHPHVIDYYFNGGRDRLLHRQQALVSAAGDPWSPVTAMDVAASLDVMRGRLNRDDPHYRYEFSTTATPPRREDVGECALAHTQQLVDGDYLTIRVIPKHRYALTDEPIGGTLTITIPDPAVAHGFQDAFEGFTKFGRALELPDGSLWATLNAPGGLSATVEGGGGWIGPALVANDAPKRFRLAVAAENGERLAEVVLDTSSHTVGPLGGAEVNLVDPANALNVVLRLSPPNDGVPRLAFSLTLKGLVGKPAQAVEQVASLLGNLAPPNELQLLMQYGTEVVARQRLPAEAGILDRGTALHIADLALLQSYAPFEIGVPEELDPAFATKLHRFARLIRGEVVTGTWDEITVELKPGVDRQKFLEQLQEGGSFAIEETQSIDFGDDKVVDIGPFTSILASICVAPNQGPKGRSIRLVPGESDQLTQRNGPIAA